jgi:hypothetical protein
MEIQSEEGERLSAAGFDMMLILPMLSTHACLDI